MMIGSPVKPKGFMMSFIQAAILAMLNLSVQVVIHVKSCLIISAVHWTLVLTI
jgi:hypothetical protein